MRNRCKSAVLIYFFIIKIMLNVDVEVKAIEVGEVAESDKESGEETVDEEATEELPDDPAEKIIHKSQFFQDIFSEHLAPLMIEFGHVCENPQEWEQRFEQKNFETNQHRGKVRWGNKDGGYGEHYWDLNHAAADAKDDDDDAKDDGNDDEDTE